MKNYYSVCKGSGYICFNKYRDNLCDLDEDIFCENREIKEGDISVGIQIISNKTISVSIRQSEKKVIINGAEHDFPKGVRGCSVSTINGKVYIDGYELINGKWKRTLRAWWHLIF